MKSRAFDRPLVGLGVLIINEKNQILLGKRKESHGTADWQLPGGHLEFGESFESCAKREVFEETGLKINNPEFLALTNDFFEAEEKHYISIFMKATFPVDQLIKNREPHKTQAWQWFSLNDLPNRLFLPLKNLIAEKSYGSKITAIKAEISLKAR